MTNSERLDEILIKHGNMWRTLKDGMTTNEAKLEICELFRGMVPARETWKTKPKPSTWNEAIDQIHRNIE